ncbi:MAG: protein tyrosine phosphatase family protein [Fibrella sp.]|nr:protein tyrosine phosphatase family protein [Armatimonadota bacterium]
MPPSATLFPALRPLYAFLPFSEQLGTAGQPTEAQFALVRDAGFETIVNLAPSNSTGALPDEDLIVEDLGLCYVSIPVRWQDPKATDLSRFFAVMDERKGREKLFVHCIANMRVSAFMYLYRSLREGIPEPEARADMHRIWTPNPLWQTFLDSQRTDGEIKP